MIRWCGTLLCVLTLATSASAECAWVLWEQVVVLSGTTTAPKAVPFDPSQMFYWVIRDAYVTRDACHEALKPEEARLKSEAERIAKEGRATVLPVKLYCLPDTVDPRGPKGKP
jgi:hypothetical protein